jgi:N-carbamoyl-L-amino-acid hydrolase
VATVGLIENRPNSRNTVPGEVFFTVDLRHPDERVLDRMEAECAAETQAVATALDLGIDWTRSWASPAVAFAPEMIDCVRAGAEQAGLPAREIVSGAGHDAAFIARLAPTAMIFVPCLGGISHNEAESTTLGECGAGAQVLLNAVLEYDRRLAERLGG